MIKTFLSIAATVCIFASFVSGAQPLGQFNLGGGVDLVYPYQLSGANVLPPNSTNAIQDGTGLHTNNVPAGFNTAQNTNLIFISVSECDAAGFTFKLTGSPGSTNSLFVYRSYDQQQHFEATPAYSFTNIAPGAALYGTNGCWTNLQSATDLAFVIANTGTGYSTNASLTLFLKTPKRGAHEVAY